MKKLTVVYFTGTGHTKLLAEAVAAGAGEIEGIAVSTRPILGSHITEGRYENPELFEELAASDAIVFGSPTYMGTVAAQFKAFADASGAVWFSQGWKNKIAGGFTGSGSPSGDKLSTLQYLALLASQHSMHWISAAEFPSQFLGKTDGVNRLGSFLGVMAQNESTPGQPVNLDPGDEKTARAYGRRIAECTIKWHA
ncbi:MAG: flavodoxin family protein [Terrimicrobiaceae bacterium]|nr:flavodoxin family protein [Terrimicrobiaceae bacterium]